MTTRLATAPQNAATDAVVDRVDLGSTNAAGRMLIYTGSQPATANTGASGTLLATVVLANPAFGSSSSGLATGTDPASVNAGNTGTPGWFRVVDRDAAGVYDGAVGLLTSVSGATDDTLTTSAAHGLAVGNVVYMTAGITGIAAGAYVVILVPSSTTFKIATYGSSTPVDITAATSASFSTAELTLSSLSLTAGAPVDITSLTYFTPGG